MSKRELPKSKNTKSDISWRGTFHSNHKLNMPSIKLNINIIPLVNNQYGRDL